jgi:TonB family protein
MSIPRRPTTTRHVLLLAVILVVLPCSLRSQASPDGPRKVLTRVPPQYPNLARSMNIRGNVKVEALVVSDGTVKSVQIKGGHPILAQAAQDAVHHWTWEPLSHATTELVEIRFNPQ